MNEKTLPLGWAWTNFEDTCEVIMGQSPPSSTYNQDGIGLPFFQGKAEFGDLYPTPVKWCSKPNKIAEADDILISVRAPVGPTNLCREQSCIGRGLAAIRPKDEMGNLYFLYWLRYIESDWDSKSTGTTFKAISGKVLRSQEIPLPPLAEQHRIVAEIEKQLTRLDAGVAALHRAQVRLQRYKAAVLKAACEGRLVPQDPDDEPAAVLLDRILTERREQWIGKGKYKEPQPPNTDGLPELPQGWVWATTNQLASHEPNSITDGPFGSKLKTAHYTETGPRVIRLQNIGDGKFYDEKAHISYEHFETLQRHEIFAGDLVIAALGPSLPRACIIPEYVGPAIVKADCMRFKPHPELADAKYLLSALNSDVVKRIAAKTVHGIGRPRLNQQEIKSLSIPLPPLAEQQRIVAEVERRLSVVEEVEATLTANLHRAERLRQSILKQAFEGRLVAQDSADEPASVLLARIRAERAAVEEKKKRGRQLELPGG